MKLNVFTLGVKLALGVMSKRLAVSAAASKLSLRVAALKVTIALGTFIKYVLAVDIVSIQEQIAKYFTKNIIDSIDIQDNLIIVPTKVLGDRAGFSDGEPYFAEDYITGAPSDQTYTEGRQPVWEMLKILVELPTTIASTLVLTFNRGITDTSNINDSVNIVSSKGINDAVSISEIVLLSVTSGLSDAVGAGSTGSLYSQGYVDFSYFAEDYVGDSRVFS